jgi:hypothetical protein
MTVKKAFRREHQLLLAVASVCLHPGAAWADGVSVDPADADDSGFTVLSNAALQRLRHQIHTDPADFLRQ